ncbi:MAG: tRNA (cytidine(34)-2'-O)-methyltransferase [Clostridiaceae bacterium]|jgi:tRNA (cytidine/uridine-2'-O-)-methyltransferase|nr:tRNA (cytidine(34)-2'-O)-methyltransferase [Bacillota bacterium]NLN51951.1 tRNA (cytidine(34)-2'-O)-methyltransferase [Clostridiaceae bacterium]
MIHIVLVEPVIPPNTGNIARTCVATNTQLHLVEPLGFSLDDRALKRAGLDYWFDLNVNLWADLDHCLPAFSDRQIYYVTTKGEQLYSDVQYDTDCALFFGKEDKGLPEEILSTHPERCIRIPMANQKRSLNLANSVSIVLYEALRQQGFPGLK